VEDLVSYGIDDTDDDDIVDGVASTVAEWPKAVLAIADSVDVDDTTPVDDGTLDGRSEADSPVGVYGWVSCVAPAEMVAAGALY
jgi:hypothetical protein